MFKSILKIVRSVRKRVKRFYTGNTKPMLARVPAFVDAAPLISLGIVLGVLFAVIIVGSFLRKPQVKQEDSKPSVKQVEVFQIGQAPRITVDAEIEKSGVITIAAQTSGVVQSINIVDGQDVWRGAWLVGLSSNYQGGSIFSLQRQLAQTQLNNIENTYQLQIDTIERQRELAYDVNGNDENLREISRQSNEQTEQAINLNDEILSTLEQQLATLIDTSASDDDILAKKQIISQFTSANLQLNTSLRNGQYTANDDNLVANISAINRDVLLNQLAIQEKALELSMEIATINLRIAQINESFMNPASPFEGRVEKVHIRIGELVNPGTPLVTISGSENAVTAIAYLPKKVTDSLSSLEDSIIAFDDVFIEITPTYISQEAVRGQLYAVIYSIPSEYAARVTDHGIVKVDIPIGSADTSASVPFVPLTSIYQSDTASYIYLVEDGIVVSRDVELGGVQGGFVEILEGIDTQDQVIVNRTVVNGDRVEVIN